MRLSLFDRSSTGRTILISLLSAKVKVEFGLRGGRDNAMLCPC